MQNTFSQSGNDSKWFLTKIIFQNRYVALETGLDPPPFMANAILNFHFDYLNSSLIDSKPSVATGLLDCAAPTDIQTGKSKQSLISSKHSSLVLTGKTCNCHKEHGRFSNMYCVLRPSVNKNTEFEAI